MFDSEAKEGFGVRLEIKAWSTLSHCHTDLDIDRQVARVRDALDKATQHTKADLAQLKDKGDAKRI